MENLRGDGPIQEVCRAVGRVNTVQRRDEGVRLKLAGEMFDVKSMLLPPGGFHGGRRACGFAQPVSVSPCDNSESVVLCLEIFPMLGYYAALKIEPRSEEKKDEV